MSQAIQKAYKIRAYLTPKQRRAFAQAEGATRYVRRRVLGEMDAHYKATGTRKSLLEMGREVTQWKQAEETLWLKDNPSDVIYTRTWTCPLVGRAMTGTSMLPGIS